MKIFNTPCKDKHNIVPYKFSLIYPSFAINPYILDDLADLKNSLIKELDISIDNSLSNTQILRFRLRELLSNANIKKLNIQVDLSGNDDSKFLLLLSKLIRNNDSIKEVSLILNFKRFLNSSQKQVLKEFSNIISNRLIKVNIDGNIFYNLNKDTVKLLFCSSKLYETCYKPKLHEKVEVIKLILSSAKYLNTYEDKGEINHQYLAELYKSEDRVEINTYFLRVESNKNYIDKINDAYKFKVETIKINFNFDQHVQKDKEKIKEIYDFLDCILKLPNNPNNTIKRILISLDNYNKNDFLFKEQLLSLLKSNDYALDKIPKIFIYDYREFKIVHKNSKFEKLIYSQKNEQIKFDEFYFYEYKIIFKKKNIYKCFEEFLYLLLNRAKYLEGFSFSYSSQDIDNKTTYPQFIVDNASNMIKEMKSISNKFKKRYTFSGELKRLKRLKIYFDENYPEFNVFYYTILEIMSDMNCLVETLFIYNCNLSEFEDFIRRNKKLRSLNINDIEIRNSNLDGMNRKKLDSLCDNSHLINGKIKLIFCEQLYIDKEAELKEILNFVHSKLTNFIEFHFSYSQFFIKSNYIIQFYSEKDIDRFIDLTQRIMRLSENTNSMMKKKALLLGIDFNQYTEYNSLIKIFSLLKKNYIITRIDIINSYFLHKIKGRRIAKSSIELILYCKYNMYRERKVKYSVDFLHSNLFSNRKQLKYLKLHKISDKLSE